MARHKEKGRLPPFIPLLIDTMNQPAWRALSHGARSLYIALKRRYDVKNHNNGRLFLSQRDASAELGSHHNEIARCYRELQHYGFIVMERLPVLRGDGKGTAPRWRLTELGYMHDPPTRDFARWDGTKFKRSGAPFPARGVRENQHTSVRQFQHTSKDKCAPFPAQRAAQGVCAISSTELELTTLHANWSVPLSDPWSDHSRGVWRHNIAGDKIANVGAVVSTLGTFDAGLIATNPGVP